MANPKQPEGNPAFKYMGLPTLRAKLPSRNWLIFFGITGTFAGIIYHDRHEQKRIQKEWCLRVSHLALEPLGTLQLPRKVTVYLSAPPGSGTDVRPAQEHFRDFVKPIFVAAALDVEFVEGRRMGEVRAKVAQRVRKFRRMEDGSEGEEDVVEETRRKAGITRVGAVQGDVVLGRHAWKEYVQGLHEGWLGPLEAPPIVEEAVNTENGANPDGAKLDDVQKPDERVMSLDEVIKEGTNNPPNQPTDTKPKPLAPPPYILPTNYAASSLPSSAPTVFDPVGVVPFPHILGFLNTPTRFYRFITRRHLADLCGREAAAIALGAYSRPFETAEAIESVLVEEELDWPKKYWKDEELQGVWQERIVADQRLVARMRRFWYEETDK